MCGSAWRGLVTTFAFTRFLCCAAEFVASAAEELRMAGRVWARGVFGADTSRRGWSAGRALPTRGRLRAWLAAALPICLVAPLMEAAPATAASRHAPASKAAADQQPL